MVAWEFQSAFILGSVSVRDAPPEEIFLNNCMWSGFEKLLGNER